MCIVFNVMLCHLFFAPFLFILSSFFTEFDVCLTTTGLPKNASNLGWTPLLALIFFIAPSNLLSAKPFSPIRNFLKAY